MSKRAAKPRKRIHKRRKRTRQTKAHWKRQFFAANYQWHVTAERLERSIAWNKSLADNVKAAALGLYPLTGQQKTGVKEVDEAIEIVKNLRGDFEILEKLLGVKAPQPKDPIIWQPVQTELEVFPPSFNAKI